MRLSTIKETMKVSAINTHIFSIHLSPEPYESCWYDFSKPHFSFVHNSTLKTAFIKLFYELYVLIPDFNYIRDLKSITVDAILTMVLFLLLVCCVIKSAKFSRNKTKKKNRKKRNIQFCLISCEKSAKALVCLQKSHVTKCILRSQFVPSGCFVNDVSLLSSKHRSWKLIWCMYIYKEWGRGHNVISYVLGKGCPS